MGWGLWSSPPASGNGDRSSDMKRPDTTSTSISSQPLDPLEPSFSTAPTRKKKNISWNDSLNAEDWEYYKTPRGFILPGLAVGFAVGFWVFWRSYLRRLNGAGHITPGYFRKRSLFGKVTSVGDGDGFHLFHTPGGRLAGWGWLRTVPKERKELKGRTISIRLAGVDAPEAAHFGRPAQPYSAEAMDFLQDYILGRRVRAYIYKRDQYERIVATVFVRKPPFFLRKDVGKELLKRGLATIYESKTGAEFGGPAMEKSYRTVEAVAKRKKKGIWSVERAGFLGFGKKEALETPREYKERIRKMENGGAVKVVSPKK
ncbi:nuclease domain-containing protein [Cercophora newfieldiana]|uniref:Probable endonuclease LCL3 n=1 Tax=Cercophora newfieldiana TaxID=92897 RepID=A0AA40D034_9PEZI|nr:nuclease domain-containing protein [Cercophora newfieldiana]